MPFFAPGESESAEPPRQQYTADPWRPPDAWVPAAALWNLMVARNEDTVVTVHGVLAYPQGLAFTVACRLRPGTEGPPLQWRLRSRGRVPTMQDGLDVQIEFDDGRRTLRDPAAEEAVAAMNAPAGSARRDAWTDPDAPLFGVASWVDRPSGRRASAEPDGGGAGRPTGGDSEDDQADSAGGPHLATIGGRGVQLGFEQDMWLWPLPPPGRLHILCAWPERRLPETRTAVEVEHALQAATGAVELWPLSAAPEPDV